VPNSTAALLLALLAGVAVLDLIATICITRSSIYTAHQKAMQVMLTWLIPFVGSIFVLAVLFNEHRQSAAVKISHGNGSSDASDSGSYSNDGSWGHSGGEGGHGGDGGSSAH
jgi:uncharacterized membrane protein YgcG